MTAVLATSGALDAVGRSALAVLDMAWATLWALVFGFLLSGAVQRMVPADATRRGLGDHSPRTVAKATMLGAASSSCSYAAAATSRSLFKKGADAVTSVVFMVASTNLVIELGAVILGLLGWRFLAAQLAGGVVMVVLLAVAGGLVVRGRLVTAARARVASSLAATSGHDHCHDEPAFTPATLPTARSWAVWSDAADLGLKDASMVKRELVVGFVVAGVLSAVVPTGAWSALFLHGHGVWTSVENAMLAPLLAVVSCVCSVGNVPLAATLWHGGIGFGGTIAFLFADVLALPLLFVYGRYYGLRYTLRLAGLLYAVIVVAALFIGGVFSLAGLTPTPGVAASVVGTRGVNLTSLLNVVAIASMAALLVSRGRRRRHDRVPAPRPIAASSTLAD